MLLNFESLQSGIIKVLRPKLKLCCCLQLHFCGCSDTSYNTHKPLQLTVNSRSRVSHSIGTLWGNKTYTCRGSVIQYSLSFYFIMERHSIKTYTLAKGGKNKAKKSVLILWEEGVLPVRDSLMSLQAEFQRRNPWTTDNIFYFFFLPRMPLAGCGRDGLLPPGSDLNSQPVNCSTGKSYSESSSFHDVPINI